MKNIIYVTVVFLFLFISQGCQTNKSSNEIKNELKCDPAQMNSHEWKIFQDYIELSVIHHIGTGHDNMNYNFALRHEVVKGACFMFKQHLLMLEENF